MFKTNNRPHWWALWAVYVSIPIGFFIYKMNNFRYADADEAKVMIMFSAVVNTC